MADEATEKEQGNKDPLSFFAAGDDSSSSDSDNDDDTYQKTKTPQQDEDDTETFIKTSKLPSPHTLFATVGKPKFLNRLQEDSAVDWDELSTRYNPAVIAAAPTVSLEEREKDEAYTDATISSTPIQYGKELSDIQKHIVLHGKRGSDIRLMTHRESQSQNEEGESCAKKAKADSFRQKEKRKRDQGQANRDKSYVEEEKRILRQGAATE